MQIKEQDNISDAQSDAQYITLIFLTMKIHPFFKYQSYFRLEAVSM